MLPAQLETLTGDDFTIPSPPAGLTAAPFETRWFLSRLATLTVFYVIFRGWLAGRSLLRKLAYVSLVNGALLSIVGLAQFFGPHPKRVLWLEEFAGTGPFSTFICRTHFAFYINLCIGLGIGLLFQDPKTTDAYKAVRRRSEATQWQDRLVESISGLFAILQNPRAAWIISLIALCVVCIPLSQSRGGAAALLAASAATFAVWSRVFPSEKRRISMGIIIPFLGACGLAIHYSWPYLATRLEGGGVGEDDRTDLWLAGARMLPSFWVLGSGAGSFQFVEPLRRGDVGQRVYYDHAHNEYLEAALEGGLPRLIVTAALIFLAFRFAVRACRVHARGQAGPLALGCFFGLTAVAVQSVVDFGIHLGSIALLTAAVTACVSSLATDYSSRGKGRPAASSRALAIAAALLFPPLCAFLAGQSWLQWRAETFQREAMEERTRPLTPTSLERRLAFSAAAVAASPGDPAIRVLRGQCLADAARHPETTEQQRTEYIGEALRHWLTARAVSPLMPQPHAFLGNYSSYFKTGDTALAYYERARRLQPFDAEIWYVCGLEHWNSLRDADAVDCWRRSLELSPERMKEILSEARKRLTPLKLAESIMPDNPFLLGEATRFLYPDAEANAAERLPFLAKAARLLEASPDPVIGYQLMDKARIQAEVGETPKAIETMRKAIRKHPDRIDWRIELAMQLRYTGQFKEAVDELRRALEEDRSNGTTKYWYDYTRRELMLRE